MNKGYIYLYQIDCKTENYKFVGTTKNPAYRRKSHEDGTYHHLTRDHGVEKFTVLNRFKSKDAAVNAALARIKTLEDRGYAVYGTGKSSIPKADLEQSSEVESAPPVTHVPPRERPLRSTTVDYLVNLL